MSETHKTPDQIRTAPTSEVLYKETTEADFSPAIQSFFDLFSNEQTSDDLDMIAPDFEVYQTEFENLETPELLRTTVRAIEVFTQIKQKRGFIDKKRSAFLQWLLLAALYKTRRSSYSICRDKKSAKLLIELLDYALKHENFRIADYAEFTNDEYLNTTQSAIAQTQYSTADDFEKEGYQIANELLKPLQGIKKRVNDVKVIRSYYICVLNHESETQRADALERVPQDRRESLHVFEPILKMVVGKYEGGRTHREQLVHHYVSIEMEAPGLLVELYQKIGLIPDESLGVLELKLIAETILEPTTFFDDYGQLNEYQRGARLYVLEQLNKFAGPEILYDIRVNLGKQRNLPVELEHKLNVLAPNVENIFLRLDERLSVLDLSSDIDKAKELILLKKFLPLGLDAKACLAAWFTRTAKPNNRYRILHNLKRIETLEDIEPGSAVRLNKEFGILHFERYPLGLLLVQLHLEASPRPYVLVINPYSDHNSAFSFIYKLLGSLAQQLDDLGYGLVVAEAGTKIGVARRLLSLDKRFGDKHKIPALILGGHGTKDSIAFGGNDPLHQLRTSDLGGTGSAARFLEPDPTIILISCSTGEKGGIAEGLAKSLEGARIIAPEKDADAPKTHMIVTKIDGKLTFDVQYKYVE